LPKTHHQRTEYSTKEHQPFTKHLKEHSTEESKFLPKSHDRRTESPTNAHQPFTKHLKEYTTEESEYLLKSTKEEILNQYDNTTTSFQMWWKEQTDMKKRISRTCEKYGFSIRPQVKRKNFMYDPKHNLLYCRIGKVGTTTWLNYFLSLSNLPNKSKILVDSSPKLHKRIPPLFKLAPNDPDVRILAQSAVSFSTVRHPFERVVSAYQDKIVDAWDMKYEKTRQLLPKKYGDSSFTSFLLLILSQARTKCRRISNCALDVHWRPYISRCAFCDVPYRVIVRSETFSEDVAFISELSGVKFPSKTKALHVSSGGSSQDKAIRLFKQVRLSLVKRLYKLYEADFEMFGYSPQLYFDIADKI